MNITWFRSLTEPQGLLIWHEERAHFLHFLADVTHGPVKNELPLWSPATFKGDRRCLANVIEVRALVFDVDDPWPDVASFDAAIHAALPGTELAYHTSWSSVLGALKMRAIVFLSRPVTGAEYRLMWMVVARKLAASGIYVDTQCKDASRAYFVPAIPPSGVYQCGDR